MSLVGRRGLLFTVAIGLLISGILAGVTGVAASTSSTNSTPDGVVVQADVAPNGTATISVTYRFKLNTENKTEAFQKLQNSIENNRSAYESQFESRLSSTVTAAENRTNRSMTLRNISVSTTTEEFPQEYGVVTYTAEWTNFAVTDGERIRIGDALSGFYLDDRTRLVVSWPESYTIESVTPSPATEEPDKAIWAGPRQFSSDEPRLVISPGTQNTEETTTVDTTTSPGDTDNEDTFPVTPIIGGLVLVALAAGGYFYRQSGTSAASETDDGEFGSGSTTARESPSDDSTELMSDREQVLTLLEEEGGRMKQQRLVDEYDWSESKTSRVVNNLDDEGVINKYRIGRENVIMDPDEDEFSE